MSKRRVDYDAEQELRFQFETNNLEWGDPTIMECLVDVLNAAFKGGANLNDLFLMQSFIRVGFENSDRLDQNLPLIIKGQAARSALREHNAKRALPDDVKQEVSRLYSDLSGAFPKDASRFREIAKRLDLTTHQVRHILKPSKRKLKV